MLNSPIKWMGGKYRLRKQIIELIPEHTCYCEVFGGAGWVLFAKEPSRVEIYNDVNGELVNLFRIIKKHPEEFIKQFDDILLSREQFEAFKRADLAAMTDIERAARFYCLIHLSFSARMQSFMIMPTRPPFNLLQQVKENIKVVRDRLQKVIIENRDFEKVIESYDRETTFFYLDPPYFETEDYGSQGSKKFTQEDQVRLRDLLKDIKGKFLLSLNDCEFIRELYKEFVIVEVSTRYSVGKTDRGIDRKELFIANYDIRAGFDEIKKED